MSKSTTARTVLHGVPSSVESFDKLPPSGHWASRCVTEDLHAQHGWDGSDLIWKPIEYIAFRFDIETAGGGVGWYGLGVTVPDNTIILDGLVHILREFESLGAATLSFKVESAAVAIPDLINAAALGTLTTDALLDIGPVGTAATAILVGADREIKCHVQGAAFTAGVAVGFLRCLRSFEAEEESSSSSPSCSCSLSCSCSCSSSCSSVSSSSISSSLSSAGCSESSSCCCSKSSSCCCSLSSSCCCSLSSSCCCSKSCSCSCSKSCSCSCSSG